MSRNDAGRSRAEFFRGLQGGQGANRCGMGGGWMSKNREKRHPMDPDIVAVCTIGGVRMEMGAWFEPKRHGYRLQFSLPADAPWRPEEFGPDAEAGPDQFNGVDTPFGGS